MATGNLMASSEQELVLTRVFDAPRKLVFKAWTDPKCVAVWWGPHHFTNPVCELDARPGGAIRIHMRDPTTVTFSEQGGKTKQIMRARVIKMTPQAAPYIAGMEQGWTQSLERLAAFVATQAKE